MNGKLMDNENADFIREIGKIAENVQVIIKEAVMEIEPQVDEIICRHDGDKRKIETLLDRLLDYAGIDDTGLVLFKCLCRYYYSINPNITADYVYAYKDLYNSEVNDD